MKESRLFPKKHRTGLLALALAGLLPFSGALAADYEGSEHWYGCLKPRGITTM